jgi:hypothetical protein
MEDLTPDQILQMFRDFGLEGEEQRESFRQLAPPTGEDTKTSNQLFIRIVPSTSLEEEQHYA